MTERKEENSAAAGKLAEQLRQVADTFDGVNSELQQAARLMDLSGRCNLQERLLNLERIAEKNTVRLRNLTARMQKRDLDPFYGELAGVLGIRIEEQTHWIRITVPSVLPGRGSRDSRAFLLRPLRHMLVEFERKTPMERFGACAICIVHRYDEALGPCRLRSCGSQETKWYLETIESFFLAKESICAGTVLQTTAVSDRDETDFYVMLPGSLPGWAAEHMAQDQQKLGGQRKEGCHA